MEIIEIVKRAEKRNLGDISALKDYFDAVVLLAETDAKEAHKRSKEIRTISAREASKTGSADMLEIYRKSLLFDAKEDFDAYLQYLEWNRKPSEKFYMPRRKVLKPLVDAMQMLADDELDELFLSMPPRVGKTSILMFYATWIIGKSSEKSNLYSAYSDTITTAFYNGVLEVLTDPYTYLWTDVFPEAKIVGTNAKEETLNIDRKKRYPSLTARSLYGTLNGACDCNGILIADDLIGGIEEALNKDRLVSAWSKVDNNLIPRAKEKAKILWCGTRWSQADPAGVRMDLLLSGEQFKNRRFKIINVPALDENEQSNFEYKYDVGFSTEYYLQRRASFERNNDIASWLAQYMGEPIERSGALFEPQDMKYYNGVLPEEEPVRIFTAIDPAYGGGDYTSAPVCYEYSDGSVYVADVIYSDGDKTITQPKIVDMIKNHKIQAVQIEGNKSTSGYKDEVERMLTADGVKVNITMRSAPNNVAKEIRIFDKAPEIREFYFLENGKRNKEYEMFMQNVFAFKMIGKNKHDDSVDSLAQAVDMMRSVSNFVVVSKRPF